MISVARVRSLVGLAAGVLFLAGSGSGCDRDGEQLLTVPTVQEANEIVVALERAGVHGSIVETTAQRKSVFAIRVAGESDAAARRVLVDNNLPRTSSGGFEQMIAGASMIPTASDEQARLTYALAGELEKTLETIDGVAKARVHVVLSERSPLADPAVAASPPSATVLLRTKTPLNTLAITAGTTRPGDAATVEDRIRLLVAQAVPGLSAERVSVLSSVVAPSAAAKPDEALKQASDERDHAVASNRQLQTVVVALAALSVVSVGVAVVQHLRARRA